MARAKLSKASMPMAYHCGMCDQSFKTKTELNYHTANHADNRSTMVTCAICQWPFDDSHALEQHQIVSGHGTPQFACENCEKSFVTQRGLDDHMKPPSACRKAFAAPPAMSITCDRCPNTFSTQREYDAHRSFPVGACADHKKKTPPKARSKPAQGRYVDPDTPKQTANEVLVYDDDDDDDDDDDLDEPDDMGDDDRYCGKCKKVFDSQAAYVRHAFACSMTHGSEMRVPDAHNSKVDAIAAKHLEVRQPPTSSIRSAHVLSVQVPALQGPKSLADDSRPMQTIHLNTRQPVTMFASAPAPPQAQPPPPRPTPSTSSPSPAPSSGDFSFVCSARGCEKTFRSEAGLKTHEADTHGIGGQRLDIHGSASWMLGQRERERLKAEGLLRAPPSPSRGRGRGGRTTSASTRPLAALSPRPHPAPATRPPLPMPVAQQAHISSPPVHHAPPRAPVRHAPALAPGAVPTSMNMGGPAEMDQAKFIQGKTLRLLIQSDIFIKHDGSMTVCGIDWTRIGVFKQHDVVDMFDGMCHLPKILQSEYLPPPKSFKDEYAVQYPVAEFKHSPDRDLSKPGLGVVSISCSKVLLADGRQEIVKVAAVDVVTCRVLMNHLVCTDPHSQVANWRSSVTGLFGWRDMEGARQAGYRIFKGWSAARSALWKFVDKDTIIIGHNLRSDLDALRMIHGRAVDVAKVVEKAAQGPLSKAQLSLDSLSRNYPDVHLKTDPEYGRDCLMNAFAARELGLWAIKNPEKLGKDAKQKSLDYQKVMPKAAA